jgi:hypothetical protein
MVGTTRKTVLNLHTCFAKIFTQPAGNLCGEQLLNSNPPARKAATRRRAARSHISLATFAVGWVLTPGGSPCQLPHSLNRITLVGSVTFLLAAWPAHSQMAAPKPAAPALRTAGSTPRQQPCWQEGGISKGVIEQRRSIEQNTRAWVESVCADSSLTPQQKRQKIKELRQQARQQIDAIITPQQQEELKACIAQRATNRPAPPPRHGTGGLGPCGEMSASPTPAPSEGDHASGTPAPPQP